MACCRPTRFPDLNDLLGDMAQMQRRALGEAFVGTYLQGSFAVGEADRDSDVDFLVAVSEELTAEQVAALNAMHGSLYARDGYWPKHLEGSYVPLRALRRYRPGQPPWHYLDNGSRELVLSDHDDSNVVRWSLREHGIVLEGPSAAELVDEVSVEALKREIYEIIQHWGNRLAADPAYLGDAWRQPYVVLSFCRMLQSLETGRVGSKRAGASWALRRLDAPWHPLIEEALEMRKGQFGRAGAMAKPETVQSTIAFIRSAQSVSTRLLKGCV